MVLVSGPEDRDTEAKEVIREVIRNFEGTPSEVPPAHTGLVVRRWHILAAGGALLVVLWGSVRWWRNRRTPGTAPAA